MKRLVGEPGSGQALPVRSQRAKRPRAVINFLSVADPSLSP